MGLMVLWVRPAQVKGKAEGYQEKLRTTQFNLEAALARMAAIYWLWEPKCWQITSR